MKLEIPRKYSKIYPFEKEEWLNFSKKYAIVVYRVIFEILLPENAAKYILWKRKNG